MVDEISQYCTDDTPSNAAGYSTYAFTTILSLAEHAGISPSPPSMLKAK